MYSQVPDFSRFEELVNRASRNGSTAETELIPKTCTVLLALAGVEHVDFKGAPERLLHALSYRGEIRQGTVVAACLLRLLPIPAMSWLSGMEWRRYIVAFLEQECGRIVYSEKEFSRVRNTAAHARIAEFARRVSAIEREFLSVASSILSLDSVHRLRADFLRHLASQFTQVVISPFLPEIFRNQLTEFFRRLEAYKIANEANKPELTKILEEYQAAKDMGSTMFNELTLWSSRYAAIVRKNVVEKLLVLLEEDISKNQVVQKATLRVEFRHKKFPLHRVGALVRVEFSVLNHGPGFAHDIKVMLVSDDSIVLSSEEFSLPRLAPNESYSYEITGEIKSAVTGSEFVAQVTWSDFRGERSSADSVFTALPQRGDIDWDQLAQSDPYSPEPVTNERDLVGRRDVLNRLLGMTRAKGVGSSIIHGQKRVGKTSIARVLQTLLKEPKFIVIYLESGDYAVPSATGTVRKLGRRIVSEIRSRDPHARELSEPNFDDALAPLAEFIDSALAAIPERKIIIFLDEFDEIATDLYARGPLGDAFFLTLRSISSRPRVGFVLIGGEKMSYIISVQGNRVNKWDVIPVDYFSREASWSDYCELVQRPTQDALEFSESALVMLHDVTAGNPYFTKLICRQILTAAVQQHDSHITDSEVKRAIKSLVVEVAENTFAHFWDDAMLVDGDIGTKKVAVRKKILVALADVLSPVGRASLRMVVSHRLLGGVSDAYSELNEFVARGIIVEMGSEPSYAFKVPLFERWLQRRSNRDRLLAFSEGAAYELHRIPDNLLPPSEIEEVIAVWPRYKGSLIVVDDVAGWLRQFGGLEEQRAMLSVLRGVKFFSYPFVKEQMCSARMEINKSFLRAKLVPKLNKRGKRSDLVIAHSGDEASHECAKIFALEASTLLSNVIPLADLNGHLEARAELAAIVFVTSLGCGTKALRDLEELFVSRSINETATSVKLYIVMPVGLEMWKRQLELIIDTKDFEAEVYGGVWLSDSDLCFSAASQYLSDAKVRAQAAGLSRTFGRLLDDAKPLGGVSDGVAVVFEFGCATPSLPILWGESRDPHWVPLFK